MDENQAEQPKKPSLDDKYGKLDKKTVDLLKQYEHDYFREDKPIPFCGLFIYPAKVRDYEELASCISCLTLNKNETPEGIRMSHLDYLINKTQIQENNEGASWSYKIQRLFEIVFHIKNGIKCDECNKITLFSDKVYIEYVQKLQELKSQIQEDPENFQLQENEVEKLKFHCPNCSSTKNHGMIRVVKDDKGKNAFSIDNHIINKDDFTKLRQIILFQNYPDYYDESGIDPEMKKDHDAKVRIQQMNNDTYASIEKKVICLSISTHYKIDEIYDMSIRHFTMALATVDDLINYKISKQAVSSGFVSLPKGKTIDHWIYKPIRDIYGDDYKDRDQLQEEVSKI